MRDVSIQKDIKLFKWFLRWAQKKHYPIPDDFKDYMPKFKIIDKTVVFLTQDELKTLYNYVIPEEGTEVELVNIQGEKYKKTVTLTTCLDRTRDMFCFCAYTGLRYSDMAKLTHADIKDDQICVNTQKTNDTLVIPLNARAKAILAKYAHAGYPGNLVFPVISNQKMNDYIKEIAELCGFIEPVKFTYFQSGSRCEEVHPKWEVLSTHAARRTFVCTALALGIPANVVMKITGHSDYSAMKPYIEIAETEKKNAMLKFDEAFKM
jgi:integrase